MANSDFNSDFNSDNNSNNKLAFDIDFNSNFNVNEISFDTSSIISVIGAGAMGSGIAQVSATFGHKTYIYDLNDVILEKTKNRLFASLDKLIEKGKLNEDKANSIKTNLHFTSNLEDLKDSSFIIEAIIENLEIKHKLFKNLEEIVSKNCVIGTNTSSISIASLTSVFKHNQRFLGVHFFNPAQILPLVEIIPSITTDKIILDKTKALIDAWGKLTVIAKDTPGFIVNRIARPYYSEAIRIYEEGIADIATIDWAMKTISGFRMGPFELMDYIGHDVNYVVTETVWKDMFFDPRFKPSISQKRLFEAGQFGVKSGKGFYDYSENAKKQQPIEDEELGNYIFNRVLAMLINEAADAVYYNIASIRDIEIAMTKGVNYPKGLLIWADEIGLENILNTLDNLYNEYKEDRYRASILLRKMVKNNQKFLS